MTLYENPNIFSFPLLWGSIEVVQLIALIRLAINLVNLFIDIMVGIGQRDLLKMRFPMLKLQILLQK